MNVDINLDAGEDAASLDSGREARLYQLVTRVSIACGAHAGDADSMRRAVALARAAGCIIGAHPGYPDREHFGRRRLDMPLADVTATVAEQVARLRDIAGEVAHVKPHGALYNSLADDPELALAVAAGVRRAAPEAALVGLAGSRGLAVWREAGFVVLAEGFADRRYLPSGALAPRGEPDVVLSDPAMAVAQARQLIAAGCDTLCVHGDNPAAETLLLALRE